MQCKMEDEECLPENSSLRLYLQNLGFTDFSVTKIPPKEPLSIRFEKPKLKTHSVETIDEDVLDQIRIIISSQMLFEEDISKVEKLLSNFKIVKNGMLKSMFKDLVGVAVIFLGFGLFWLIGYYAFFIVSSFYAFTAADYLSRKYFSRNRLKKLTSILQDNFILVKKTVKFIEENRSLEASMCANGSIQFMEGFSVYQNFKSDFLMSINEMITILAKSTEKLIITIPLYDYVENPEYYLCNNVSKNHETINMSNLYEIYLLLQSEFLQRLILSLIPNIKLCSNDNFKELNKIITETCINLLKLKNKLNKKFKYFFLNGIYSLKSDSQFVLPSKQSFSNKYSNDFLLNIHETSKAFQKLLLQCRILEEKIMSDKISDFVEQELVKIQHNISACQRNISDSLILFKKGNSLSNSSHVENDIKILDENKLESSCEKINKIVVGYSDLDPKAEDEIFEACFTEENSVSNLSDTDTWDLEDKLIKKQKKEFCKNVMDELKIKIKDKAKYWKKRERELLKKKGNNLNKFEEMTETSDEEIEVENYLNDDNMQKTSECQKILPSSESNIRGEPEYFGDIFIDKLDQNQVKLEESQDIYTDKSLFDSRLNYEKNTDLANESHKSDLSCRSPQNFNSISINDLKLARQKIFKSCAAVEEELFYASGEDSSSEDSHSI